MHLVNATSSLETYDDEAPAARSPVAAGTNAPPVLHPSIPQQGRGPALETLPAAAVPAQITAAGTSAHAVLARPAGLPTSEPQGIERAAECARCQRRGRWTKRAIDVAGALVGLTVGAPLFLVAAAAIQAEDGGPILFRQERVGEGGRPFTILKFRTMVVGTEQQGLGLMTHRDDERITHVGRWLRGTSLDELPQLINVLRGDMSLVGPRPTVPSQVRRYTPRQRRRLVVPPGLAGWAQIKGRNSIPWSQRIELDVWYVDHRSTWLDLLIIFRTVGTLLRGDGTYGASGLNADLDSPGDPVPGAA